MWSFRSKWLIRAGLGWHVFGGVLSRVTLKERLQSWDEGQHVWIRGEADLDPWFSTFLFVCTILFYFLGDLCGWEKKSYLLKICIHQVRKRKEEKEKGESEKEGAWKTIESKHQDGHSLASIRPKSFHCLGSDLLYMSEVLDSLSVFVQWPLFQEMGRGPSTITPRTQSRHMLVGREKGGMGEALVVQVAVATLAGMGNRWEDVISWSLCIPQASGGEGRLSR